MKTITYIADLTALAGIAMFLSGLYLVWYPLPLLVGGLGAIAFGILLDRGTRK